MIFILACVGGPSWSPDSSKVLFGYRDVTNSRNVVAVYDRLTRKTTTIFTKSPSGKDKEDDFYLVPQWQSDGTRALIAMTQGTPASSSETSCVLISIPFKSNIPLQAYTLGTTEGCFYPGAQVDKKVYFGIDNLRWIDLATGESGYHSFPDKIGTISQQKGQITYARDLSRSPGDAEEKEHPEKGVELGRIDLKEFTLKPEFSLWKTEIAARHVDLDHLSGVFWETGGSRVAMTVSGEDNDKILPENSEKILLLDESKGIVGVLVPDLGVKAYRLGNLVWSRDGKVLYASLITKGEQEQTLDYWLAEIPVAGTPGRLTKIARILGEEAKEDNLKDELQLSMQVSLSPDGNFIAATPANLSKDALADRDRALFLIDVQHPEHHITRIPIPGHRVPTPDAAHAAHAAAKTAK
jgi:hypothetical protein